MGEYKTIQRFDKAPEGWRKTSSTLTAPNGYEWYNNGKSRFNNKGKDYKNALVKIKLNEEKKDENF